MAPSPFSHPLAISPYYAAALALLFVFLSVRVILARRSRRVGFGAAGDPDLERRVRSQANFAEYVPFALLLIGLAEIKGAAPVFVHGMCILLVAGRLAHAAGFARSATDGFGRVVGMAGTLTAMLAAAVATIR